MKNKKLKPGIQALLMAGVVIVFMACNNSDYTKNPPSTDTTTGKTSAKTDTASSSMAMKKEAATSKKKRRVTVGTMASKTSSKMKPDKNGVYEITDVRPGYPGGQAALDNYINDNIEYPQAAIDDNSGGTVDVQFVIDKDGNVTNAKAIGKKIGSGLDEEAVRVVSNMPRWTPGKVKGKDVKTRVVLPITYESAE